MGEKEEKKHKAHKIFNWILMGPGIAATGIRCLVYAYLLFLYFDTRLFLLMLFNMAACWLLINLTLWNIRGDKYKLTMEAIKAGIK